MIALGALVEEELTTGGAGIGLFLVFAGGRRARSTRRLARQVFRKSLVVLRTTTQKRLRPWLHAQFLRPPFAV